MAHDSRPVTLSWRSYGGRKSDSSSLHSRLHKIGAIGSREGKSRESLLGNEVDIRHGRTVAGREGANNSPWHRRDRYAINKASLQHSTRTAVYAARQLIVSSVIWLVVLVTFAR